MGIAMWVRRKDVTSILFQYLSAKHLYLERKIFQERKETQQLSLQMKETWLKIQRRDYQLKVADGGETLLFFNNNKRWTEHLEW